MLNIAKNFRDVDENPGHDYKWILINIYHDIKVRLGFFGGGKNIVSEQKLSNAPLSNPAIKYV